jgi:hypothetical protein
MEWYRSTVEPTEKRHKAVSRSELPSSSDVSYRQSSDAYPSAHHDLVKSPYLPYIIDLIEPIREACYRAP